MVSGLCGLCDKDACVSDKAASVSFYLACVFRSLAAACTNLDGILRNIQRHDAIMVCNVLCSLQASPWLLFGCVFAWKPGQH